MLMLVLIAADAVWRTSRSLCHDDMLAAPHVLPLGLSRLLRWETHNSKVVQTRRCCRLFPAVRKPCQRCESLMHNASLIRAEVINFLLLLSLARISVIARRTDLSRSSGHSIGPRSHRTRISAGRTASIFSQGKETLVQLQCTRMLVHHPRSGCRTAILGPLQPQSAH